MSITITDKFDDTLIIDSYGSTLNIEPEDIGVTDYEFGTDEARELRDFLNRFLMDEDDSANDDAETAKLRLAVDHGLRVKFDYQGDGDWTARERRLEPAVLNDEYVEGESYDVDGDSEGYRRFRLDRIKSKVAVR